jgi:hypothetical protein
MAAASSLSTLAFFSSAASLIVLVSAA